MTDRVKKAIDIFLDALNEGHLVKGNCTACAVGNLVSYGMGGSYYISDGELRNTKPVSQWSAVFMTSDIGQRLNLRYLELPQALRCIEATDFNWKELARIEKTFETHTQIDEFELEEFSPEAIRADQIKGLRAVIQLMFKMDNIESSVEEEFTEKANKVPLRLETVL